MFQDLGEHHRHSEEPMIGPVRSSHLGSILKDKEVLEVHFKPREEDENKLLRKEAVITVWGMVYCT